MLNTVTRDKKILFTPLPPQDSCELFQFNKLFYETHIFFSVSQCAAFKVNAVNSAFVSLKPEPESEIPLSLSWYLHYLLGQGKKLKKDHVIKDTRSNFWKRLDHSLETSQRVGWPAGEFWFGFQFFAGNSHNLTLFIRRCH